jgi:hypothetical protein
MTALARHVVHVVAVHRGDGNLMAFGLSKELLHGAAMR